MRPVHSARKRGAKRYGSLRRSLAIAGIARSLCGAVIVAYGPVARALERAVEPAPEWLRPSALAVLCGTLDVALDAGTTYVESYAIERRFEMSEQALGSWVADRIKEECVSLGITAVLSGIFGAVVRRFPARWPLLAGAGTLPLLVLANIVVPLYILPLFNEYTPLEGPLEERLRALAARYGVGDADILRMNMSKQTKKANAFVTGIGSTHRIVVGDTLIDHFPPDEIEFVVAHELGHYVHGDSWRMIAAGEISACIVFFASSALTRDSATLPRIAWWASLVSQMLRPAISAFSRSREWAADHFALQATGAPHAGAAAFRRLRDQNLAEDEQPAWYEFLFGTHPSLKERIRTLDRATPRSNAPAQT